MAILYSGQNSDNKIFNPDFDYWDYATSQTSSGFGSDNRGYNLHVGASKTHSRQAFTLGQVDVPGNPTYYSRTVVTAGSAAGDYCLKQYLIENVGTLSGGPCTFSFWVKADSSKNIATEFIQNFGSGGSPTASVDTLGVTTHSLTTSWQKFTATLNLPSVSGATLGTNGDDRLTLNIWFDAGSTYNSRTNNLGHQSGTFDIARMRLVRGTDDGDNINTDLLLDRMHCNRYTYKIISVAAYAKFGSGYWDNTTAANVMLQNPNKMRITPHTLTTSGAGTFLLRASTGAKTVTGISLTLSNPDIINLSCTVASGGIAGEATHLLANNNTAAYILLDAEFTP